MELKMLENIGYLLAFVGFVWFFYRMGIETGYKDGFKNGNEVGYGNGYRAAKNVEDNNRLSDGSKKWCKLIPISQSLNNKLSVLLSAFPMYVLMKVVL